MTETVQILECLVHSHYLVLYHLYTLNFLPENYA